MTAPHACRYEAIGETCPMFFTTQSPRSTPIHLKNSIKPPLDTDHSDKRSPGDCLINGVWGPA